MTDATSDPPTEPTTAVDDASVDPLRERAARRSAAARGRATTPAHRPERRPPAARHSGRRPSAAPAGRFVAAGAALGGTFLAVGAMAAATAPDPTLPSPPATIERVVVPPTAPSTTITPDSSEPYPIVIRLELPTVTTPITPSTPLIRTEAPTPRPPSPATTAPDPAPAAEPVITESEGS